MARPTKQESVKKKIASLQALLEKEGAAIKRAPLVAKAAGKQARQGASVSSPKASALVVGPKLKAALATKAKSKGVSNWKTLAREALEVAAS